MSKEVEPLFARSIFVEKLKGIFVYLLEWMFVSWLHNCFCCSMLEYWQFRLTGVLINP